MIARSILLESYLRGRFPAVESRFAVVRLIALGDSETSSANPWAAIRPRG